MHRLVFTSRFVDVALIVCAMVTAWRLVEASRARERNPVPYVAPLQQQSVLAIPGIDWRQATRHVVILVRSTCPACQQSVPFYQTLSAAVRGLRGVSLTVASSEATEDLSAWLGQHGLHPDHVVQIEPYRLGFRIEPTLLMVDSTGKITDIMTQLLSPVDQKQVLARLSGGGQPLSNVEPSKVIDESALPRDVATDAGRLLLDIRERDAYAKRHRDGAVNIPADELASRAREEITPQRPVFIDCVRTPMTQCLAAEALLRPLGMDVTLIIHR